jgi:UDP-N-acetylglucosamine--N-acetylmuramyl-(pentapeptide) pyrophosphoryl-undecaprenol N-acetylglucosamine transferase
MQDVNTPSTLRVALAGGGTGGHIVPGLHLLSEESARTAIADVVWFQTGRAVEERVLAGLELRLGEIALSRVTLELEPEGGGAPSASRLASRTLPAVRVARRALASHQSEVLLGLGGFTSLPAVLAARSLGIPVALLEINASVGRATRWLAPFASRVLHAWRATLPPSPGPRHAWIGPPLAPAFAEGAPSDASALRSRAEEGFDAARPLLLVLGGSQGALGLNRFVAAHASLLAEHGAQILHQVGPGRMGEAGAPRAGYRAVEYVADVPRALRAATLVLCRGGASTLAELGALRRPAWVVPYPHHADQHQERNARELGAGVRIVQERSLDAGAARELARLLSPSGSGDRAAMAAALEGLVPLDASRRLLRELAALAGRGSA